MLLYFIFVILIPALVAVISDELGYGWIGPNWYIGVPLNLICVFISVGTYLCIK